MYKDNILTISDWQKGQVNHPVYGFGLLQNVEVFENKGIAKLKNRTLATSLNPVQLPIAELYDVYGNVYTLTGGLGNNGVLYKNGTSVQGSILRAWDAKIYKNYVWVRHATKISAYGPLDSASAQWFDSIDTTFNDQVNGCLLIGQDDYMYSGNGNTVAKITVNSSGTAGVAPSITVNPTALDLPDGQYVTCLEEFGTKIAIGTTKTSSFLTLSTTPGARLYFWNRQLGTLGNPGLADLPIIFPESGINAIKQHANRLYVSAGNQGNIYISDSVTYIKIRTLPYSNSPILYSCSVYPNALAVSSKNTLLVGLTTNSTYARGGVYEIDLNSSDYPVSFFTPSAYSSSTTATVIGFVNSKDYQTIRIGWQNNSTFGVDMTDFTMYSDYKGVIESPLIKVGDYNRKKTFSHIQWELAEPLTTGQNIRISYRKNNYEEYTTIGTWGYSILGEVISFEDIAGINDAEYVQIKIELDQSTSTSVNRNLFLIAVKLW